MLAILFRNCPHNGSATDGTNIRYALKCDTFTVQYTRQPIQIPMIGQSPEIFDLGIVRPSITLNGIVDTVGGASTTTANYQNMESISIARKYWTGGSYQSVTQTYYIPYKNKLEQAVYDWTYKKSTPVEIEIGDANYPMYNVTAELNAGSNADSGTNSETGGALYRGAIQQARFQVDPAKEDRYTFQLQLVVEAREDVTF